MIDITMAGTIFDKLLNILGLIREEKRARSANVDLALTALFEALTATKPYLDSRAAGAARNPDREFEIATVWLNASIRLREIDIEFAERVCAKGGYWMAPEAWDDEKIREKKIAFDQVWESTQKLLKA